MKKLLPVTLITGICLLVVYIILFNFVSRPVDRWVHENLAGTGWQTFGEYVSMLAYGKLYTIVLSVFFVLMIFFGPAEKSPIQKKFLYVLISLTIAILLSDTLKYSLGRYRPEMLFEHGEYGFKFFTGKDIMNSTPSGHTTRICALMTAITMLWRKALPVCIVIAVLVGVSRILVTAHYPGDIIFGFYVGTFTSLWTYKFFFTSTPNGISSSYIRTGRLDI